MVFRNRRCPLERDQPHFPDCNNIPNNAISKKEEESGKSVRIGFELHFDNLNTNKNPSKTRDTGSG